MLIHTGEPITRDHGSYREILDGRGGIQRIYLLGATAFARQLRVVVRANASMNLGETYLVAISGTIDVEVADGQDAAGDPRWVPADAEQKAMALAFVAMTRDIFECQPATTPVASAKSPQPTAS